VKPLLGASSSDEGVNSTITSVNSITSGLIVGQGNIAAAHDAHTHVIIDQTEEHIKIK